MPSDLLKFILKELESAPDATFSESELIRISKPACEAFKKEKYLKYVQYDPEKEPFYSDLPGDSGNERFIRKVNGKYTAYSAESDGITPIVLMQKDVTRWSFDVAVLCERIKEENSLSGSVSSVTSRVVFCGGKEVMKEKIGVGLGLFGNDADAEAELLGLRAKMGQYDRLLILCPTYSIRSQILLSKCSAQKMTCLPFGESLTAKSQHKINFNVLRRGSTGSVAEQKTPEQISDYAKYEYKCEDRLHLPGLLPKQKSNQIDVNGGKIGIGDSLFVLLLRFVVAAKKEKKKGGWENSGIEPGKYQPISNLRTAVQGSLSGKDGQKFIESDGSKRYRVSTHPDFITYDRAQLMRHTLTSVKELARKLPK